MTWSTRHRIAVVGFIAIVAVVVSAPAMAAAAGGDAPPAELGGQPGQLQSGANISQSNASTNATVEFSNQTTNGSTVTIQSVTLSQPGFVALHTSSYADGLVGANESVIAVSQRLSAGTHRNVTITVSHAPPGNAPGLNRSQLNETSTLVATIYGDINGNKRLDSVQSFGEEDTLVTNNSSVVRDAARVRVPSPPRRTASVAFHNQTLQNDTLTVAKARLPRGGFLIAHNESYQRSGDAVASAVAISRYLPPGNYSNVTLSVRQGALDESQTVTVRPSLDTNDNQQYDFVRSDGFQDVAYENRTGNQSVVVTETAQVDVPSSETTVSQTQSEAAASQTQSATQAASTPAAASGDTDGSSGLLDSLGLQEIVGILVLLVGAFLIVRAIR
jgi:Cu/Zn superoxide dismutase